MMTKKSASQKKINLSQFRGTVKHHKQSQQDGFTIIESLMAIIVVTILMIAIAPAIALSVANRVQARRIEFGTQAARAYVDGVRSQVIAAPLDTASMTPSAPTSATSLNCSANSYCTSTATSTTPTNLYCIDGNADGSCTNTQPRDMIIQAFRFNGNNTTATTGYSLGVRIYRADAFSDATALTSNPIQSPVGIGSRKAPLVIMTTEINDAIPKYGDFCDRTNAGLSATDANRGCN
ncbi:prepilin-type cleavage/methylation domain-containing protein [Brunnivagina elsteri CCALA 953]|uniref:Prepilin-type cleavage/methylation domain-containing protein n=2 Tax=Brunnivagina TaxID=3344733 RepID=A0A2A2TQF6_9CYAN|nr:hormogonium polysaccharide secretion pseudopilin HpsB [Calothrix elsteri]PAX60680.1 prepilin-type cleavage/methylation domain-containing protein [Calothrix elsteri CCALA 953]